MRRPRCTRRSGTGETGERERDYVGHWCSLRRGERDYDGRLSNGARPPPILHHLLQKRDGY